MLLLLFYEILSITEGRVDRKAQLTDWHPGALCSILMRQLPSHLHKITFWTGKAVNTFFNTTEFSSTRFANISRKYDHKPQMVKIR